MSRCIGCPAPPGPCVGELAPRHCELYRADPGTWGPIILAHASGGAFAAAPAPAPAPRPAVAPGPSVAERVRGCPHRWPIGCACRGDFACSLYQIPATPAECLACVEADDPEPIAR